LKTVIPMLATLLLLAAPAYALAPTLDELPTAKLILEKSKEEILARALAEEEAKKDPKMDLIKAYADPANLIYRWEPIVTILRDDKEEMKYRGAAALAIRAKFRGLDLDTRVREVKKKIAQSIVKLLMDTDVMVRSHVYGILAEFYQGASTGIRYDPTETNYMKRNKAYRDWKQFLQK